MSYTPHTFAAGGTTISFIVIKGDILPPSEAIDVTVRPGVPGGSFWQQGQMARQFTVETEEDCESLSSAETQKTVYLGMKTKGAMSVIKDDIDYASRGFKCVATDVTFEAPKAITAAVGKKVSGAATAILRAVWTLYSIPYSPGG